MTKPRKTRKWEWKNYKMTNTDKTQFVRGLMFVLALLVCILSVLYHKVCAEEYDQDQNEYTEEYEDELACSPPTPWPIEWGIPHPIPPWDRPKDDNKQPISERHMR